MELIKTASFEFELPSGGEYFAENSRLVWHNDRHELIISVTSGVGEALATLESNGRTTIERMLVKEELRAVGRVANEPTASIPCFFVTAAPADQSCLFTQAVLRAPTAIMFATFESFAYDPEHIQMWSAFVRTVRATPPN